MVMNSSFERHPRSRRDVPHDRALIIDDYLFGVPLYAYYIFDIELFDDGDVQGTLMTCPIEIYGPYETFNDAADDLDRMIEASDNGYTNP